MLSVGVGRAQYRAKNGTDTDTELLFLPCTDTDTEATKRALKVFVCRPPTTAATTTTIADHLGTWEIYLTLVQFQALSHLFVKKGGCVAFIFRFYNYKVVWVYSLYELCTLLLVIFSVLLCKFRVLDVADFLLLVWGTFEGFYNGVSFLVGLRW